jgi:flagellar hook-basal body complex protein FliE
MSDAIGGAVARVYGDLAACSGGALGDRPLGVAVPVGGASTCESFGDTLTRAINGVSEQQETAASTLQAFLRGENVEIHQVMAATEEAQISLQMLIEVRNKFADAYRTLSSMQG